MDQNNTWQEDDSHEYDLLIRHLKKSQQGSTHLLPLIQVNEDLEKVPRQKDEAQLKLIPDFGLLCDDLEQDDCKRNFKKVL